MKVLHISTGFPLSFPGGITNYLRSLAEWQVHAGFDVHVLAGPGTDKSTVHERVRVHDYFSPDIRPFTLTLYRNDPASAKALAWIRQERFDIVHFHIALDFDLDFFEGVAASGIPYILTLHDHFYICPRVYMIDYSGRRVCPRVDLASCSRCVGLIEQIDIVRRIIRRINWKLEGKYFLVPPRIPSHKVYERAQTMRQFIKRARLIMPVSYKVKEIYEGLFPDGNYRVEHLGSESAYNINRDKTRSGKISSVFIGVLNYIKGAETLLAILKRVKRSDMEFHFYGRAGTGYERILQRHGLHCHGPYTPDQLPSIMAVADIGLVIPTYNEPGPLTVQEFINYGTPVLGTSRGAISDFVTEKTGKIFEPSIPEGIDAAVNWLETVTREDLAKMASEIKLLSTPDDHAKRVHAFYDDVLAVKR